MSKGRSGDFYPTLQQAAAATLALGIESSIEYQGRYKEDRMLPSEPNGHYPDWTSWNDFLGKPKPRHYDSVNDASKATIALGIRTMAEYALRYKEDPKLPSNPHRTYRGEWSGYPAYFGLESRSFYTTYNEASAAAKALGIESYEEYMKRYREDPLLTSQPQNRYKSEWVNWYRFLDLRKKTFYKTYAEAKRVTQRAAVTTQQDYAKLARKHPRLPSAPYKVYSSDWQGWSAFLAPRKSRFYESYDEAKKAVRAMGIANGSDYRLRYKLDPKLPSVPEQSYAEEWSGWSDFLGSKAKRLAEQLASEGNSYTRQLKAKAKQKTPAYESFEDAVKAARALGVNGRREYEKSYSVDPKLRANPQKIYKTSWLGWDFFLKGQNTSFYSTYEEAKRAVRSLGIRTYREYQVRYKEDPRLPSNPNTFYRDHWESFPAFTGGSGPSRYRKLEDAAKATQALGIKSGAEYRRRFKEDPMLPHNPAGVYSSEWRSWHVFLGKRKREFYSTYSKAKTATRRLKIRSCYEYKRRYKEDPLLPSGPDSFYPDDWKGWASFLGTNRRQNRAV